MLSRATSLLAARACCTLCVRTFVRSLHSAVPVCQANAPVVQSGSATSPFGPYGPYGAQAHAPASSSSSSSAAPSVYKGETRLPGLQSISHKRVFDDVISGNFFDLALFAPRSIAAVGSGAAAAAGGDDEVQFVWKNSELAMKAAQKRPPIDSMLQWIMAWENVMSIALSHESALAAAGLSSASGRASSSSSGGASTLLSQQMQAYRSTVLTVAQNSTKTSASAAAAEAFAIAYDIVSPRSRSCDVSLTTPLCAQEHRKELNAFGWRMHPPWYRRNMELFQLLSHNALMAAQALALAQAQAANKKTEQYKSGGNGGYNAPRHNRANRYCRGQRHRPARRTCEHVTHSCCAVCRGGGGFGRGRGGRFQSAAAPSAMASAPPRQI